MCCVRQGVVRQQAVAVEVQRAMVDQSPIEVAGPAADTIVGPADQVLSLSSVHCWRLTASQHCIWSDLTVSWCSTFAFLRFKPPRSYSCSSGPCIYLLFVLCGAAIAAGGWAGGCGGDGGDGRPGGAAAVPDGGGGARRDHGAGGHGVPVKVSTTSEGGGKEG